MNIAEARQSAASICIFWASPDHSAPYQTLRQQHWFGDRAPGARIRTRAGPEIFAASSIYVSNKNWLAEVQMLKRQRSRSLVFKKANFLTTT